MDNSKYDLCLEMLSKELLKTPIGGKALTITEFCDDTNFSRGTVQVAYMRIRDTNSIEVNPRGRLGTFVQSKDYKKLLKWANIHYINVGTFLPLSLNHVGVNMGLKSNLESNTSVPVLFTQSSSSIQRLEDVLAKKTDVAIVSKYLALQAVLNNYPVKIVEDIQINTKESTKNRKISSLIDIDNGVVNEETLQVYNDHFESNIHSLIEMAIDQEQKEIKSFFNIEYVDMSNPQHQQMVLIAREDREDILQVLQEIIEINEIEEIKNKIIQNQEMNIYY